MLLFQRTVLVFESLDEFHWPWDAEKAVLQEKGQRRERERRGEDRRGQDRTGQVRSWKAPRNIIEFQLSDNFSSLVC